MGFFIWVNVSAGRRIDSLDWGLILSYKTRFLRAFWNSDVGFGILSWKKLLRNFLN